MKMKMKMSKKEISNAKKKAEHRENRRLPDGEFRRLMALAVNSLGLKDKEDDLPIIDMTKENTTIPEQILENARNLVTSRKPIQRTQPVIKNPKKVCNRDLMAIGNTEKCKSLQKEFERMIGAHGTIPSNPSPKSKKNRRMTDKQFKNLMKRASEELGINNRKGLSILNLYDSSSNPKTTDDIVALAIASLWRKHPSICNDYNELTKGKKFPNKDKLAILSYLVGNREVKPMCLRSESEKINKVRKILKPWGDIKERPFRILPDDEYFLEVQGKKRTKLDSFDRLDLDRKIVWARYANLILNMGDRNSIGETNLRQVRIRVRNAFDSESAIFAMRYACKMAKIPEFKGNFSNPYWILLRVYKFHDNMTNKEYGVYYKMALEHLNLLDHKKTLPIIGSDEAVRRLVPIMKKAGIYKQYINQSTKKHTTYSNLQLVSHLLLQKA